MQSIRRLNTSKWTPKSENNLYRIHRMQDRLQLSNSSPSFYRKSNISRLQSAPPSVSSQKKHAYKKRLVQAAHKEDRYKRLKESFEQPKENPNAYYEDLYAEGKEKPKELSFAKKNFQARLGVKNKSALKLKDKKVFSLYQNRESKSKKSKKIRDGKEKKNTAKQLGKDIVRFKELTEDKGDTVTERNINKLEGTSRFVLEKIGKKTIEAGRKGKDAVKKKIQKKWQQRNKLPSNNGEPEILLEEIPNKSSPKIRQLRQKVSNRLYFKPSSAKLKSLYADKDGKIFSEKLRTKSVYQKRRLEKTTADNFTAKLQRDHNPAEFAQRKYLSPKPKSQHFYLITPYGVKEFDVKKHGKISAFLKEYGKKTIVNKTKASLKDTLRKLTMSENQEKTIEGKNIRKVEDTVSYVRRGIFGELKDRIKKSSQEKKIRKAAAQEEKFANATNPAKKLQLNRKNIKVSKKSLQEARINKERLTAARAKKLQKKKLQRKANQKIYANIVTKEVQRKAQKAAKKKILLALFRKKLVIIALAVGGIFLAALILIALLVIGVATLSNMQIRAMYLSSDHSITEEDASYTEREINLRKQIQDIKIDNPDYAQYDTEVGAIGHDPQLLTAYLTVKFHDYTEKHDEVQAELDSIFKEQYQLVQTKYAINGTAYGLRTRLISKDFKKIIEDRVAALPEEEQKYYATLVKTLGAYTNLPPPMGEGVDWKSLITSPFGLRLSATGKKDAQGRILTEQHNGIDFALPEGTELYSMIDGIVSDIGENSSEGIYITVSKKDSTGERKITYKHLSSTIVPVGTKVKTGVLIAKSGNTGRSTAAHLHLEIAIDGKYVNPYFYLKSDKIGTPPSMTHPGTNDYDSLYPGTVPSHDGSPPNFSGESANIRALIELSMRQQGKPYKWGAEGPNSFDCSGFICYVFTKSGVKNMPRTTARGIAANYVTMISPDEAKAGDLIFFKNTNPEIPGKISHVGLYLGNGLMIHASYGQGKVVIARIDTAYFRKHFAGFGRP